MRQGGYDALVVAGRGIVSQYGYLEYISGYCPLVRHGYAVVLPDVDPALVLPTSSDAYFAAGENGLSDVRVAGEGDVVAGNDDLPSAVRDVLEDYGVMAGNIGFVGLQHIVPAGDFSLFKEYLSRADISDATYLLSDIKAVKTDDEIQALTETAEIADDGFRAAAAMMGPGVHAWDVSGEIERSVRRQGAREVLAFVAAGPYFLVRPQDQRFNSGDLVTVYVEITGPNGYWVERAGLFALGELKPTQAALASACLEAATRAEETMAVGSTASDVAVAIERESAKVEASFGIWHGHGVGVDHDLPVITANDNTPLQAGMVIAVHPNLTDKGRTYGASVADTYVIREDGKPPMRLSSVEQGVYYR